MPRVILHAGQLLDNPRDARQRPQVGSEPLCARAFAQGRFDAAHLFRSQPRLAAGTARGAQRRASTLAPRAIPAHDALAADAQTTRNRPVRLSPRGKQPRGLLATNFQSVEISSWRNMSGHAFHPTIGRRTCVTVLCEIQ